VIALGISTVAFAAPFLPQHNFGSPDFNIVSTYKGATPTTGTTTRITIAIGTDITTAGITMINSCRPIAVTFCVCNV
jgi:hypothetical protein